MLKINNLTKKYGNKVIIDNIDIELSESIVALVGKNGVGKTTLLDIISSSTQFDCGQISLNNILIDKHPIQYRSYIGYAPEIPPMYSDITVIEYLNIISSLKKNIKRNQIFDFFNQLNILDYKNVLIKNLSKGYKQRINLCQAFIGNPILILLDEPTSGLDPIQVDTTINFIKNNAKDKIIIISSHKLYDIESISNRFLIMNNSKIETDKDVSSYENEYIVSINVNSCIEEISSYLSMHNFKYTKTKNDNGITLIRFISSHIDFTKHIVSDIKNIFKDRITSISFENNNIKNDFLTFYKES